MLAGIAVGVQVGAAWSVGQLSAVEWSSSVMAQRMVVAEPEDSDVPKAGPRPQGYGPSTATKG